MTWIREIDLFGIESDYFIMINMNIFNYPVNNKNIKLHNSYPSIDLRSPKEYKKGTIPNSVNLPILNDAEFQKLVRLLRSKGKSCF